MRQPHNVLVIPFRRAPELRFCVLQRADAGWWQWVSGGMEDGESLAESATREVYEETGIHGALFSLDTRAFVPKTVFAPHTNWPSSLYVVEQHTFALEASTLTVTLSHEHVASEWLAYELAFQRLRWQNDQTALWELNQRIRDENLSIVRGGTK